MVNNKMMVNRKLLEFKRLLSAGKLAKAKKLIFQHYRSEPDNEQVLKACVLASAKDKDLRKAIFFADKLLQQEPANFGYVTNLANWCLALARTEQAATYYQQYINSYPGNPKAYFRLGLVYKLRLEYKLAVEMLKTAIDSGYNPLEDCYLQLALTHGEFRQELEAISCLEQVLKLNPSHQIAKLNLATLLQAAGRKPEAEQIYEEILAQAPSFTEALVRRIYSSKMTVDQQGFLDLARTRLTNERLSVQDRESLSYAVGKAYDDLGSYADAMQSYRSANELQAKRIGVYKPDEIAGFVKQVINLFTTELFNNPVSKSQLEPIFIVGHFRSGSTLVEQLLAGHSAIESLGEVDYFIRLYHEQRSLFESLQTTAAVELLEEIAAQYTVLTATMASNSKRITDKRPENLLFMGLIKRIFPKAKFIHTQRNLLDNSVSVYFQQLNDLSKYATGFASFADYDSQCQQLMRHWQTLFGSSIFSLQYEKLVLDPETHTRELLAFLGLQWEPGCLDFDRRSNFVRTASVSQVREKIYTSSVGRGQNYLQFMTAAESSHYS